jgi:hypothetical protein
VRGCVAREAGVSNACADCFAGATECTLDNCLAQCIAGDVDRCLDCAADACGEPLQQCSGFEL